MNLKAAICLFGAVIFLSACKEDDNMVVDNHCPSLNADQTPRYPLPDAFTPDGNGRNDRLMPLADPSITAFELSIYDRSGDKVATTSDALGWNGLDSRTGKIAVPAPYLVRYKITHRNAPVETGELWVTIFERSATESCVYIPAGCDYNSYTFPDQYSPDTTYRFATSEIFCRK